MKRISWGFAVLAILVTGLFSFQNCAKIGGFTTDEAIVDVIPEDQSLLSSGSEEGDGFNQPGTTSGSTGGSSNGGNSGGSSTSGGTTGGTTGDTTVTIPSNECMPNYFTIFPWTNSEVDLSTAAPVIGATKIKTFKIYNASAVPIPSVSDSGPGWTIGARIDLNTAGTATQTNLIIAKNGNAPKLDSEGNPVIRPDGSTQSANSLICYFGPDTVANDGSAKIVYENIGVDPLINHVGFISAVVAPTPTKWVACKVNMGTARINFRDADGTSFNLEANRPFIVKRGCFP